MFYLHLTSIFRPKCISKYSDSIHGMHPGWGNDVLLKKKTCNPPQKKTMLDAFFTNYTPMAFFSENHGGEEEWKSQKTFQNELLSCYPVKIHEWKYIIPGDPYRSPNIRVGLLSDSWLPNFPKGLEVNALCDPSQKDLRWGQDVKQWATWRMVLPKGSGCGTPSLHGHKWLLNVGWS